MFVRPAPGMRVLRPDTFAVLNEAGEHVPTVDYWYRRLTDGDVTLATPPEPAGAQHGDAA